MFIEEKWIFWLYFGTHATVHSFNSLIIVVQKSLVTTTTTRRKEQQEMIRKAFQAEEERKRVGRERFPMTTIPVNQLAAYEPAIHHASEEHEEGELQNKRTAVIDRTQHAEGPRDWEEPPGIGRTEHAQDPRGREHDDVCVHPYHTNHVPRINLSPCCVLFICLN